MAKRKTKAPTKKPRATLGSKSLKSPKPLNQQYRAEHFINRELSWLEFNARVLEEAQDSTTPLLDRLKFLAIFSSNLDEFFMVRVSGLREQAFSAGAPQDRNADGMLAVDQICEISIRARALVEKQYQCLNEDVLPKLADEGLVLATGEEFSRSRRMKDYFRDSIFPILTPMAIDPSHPRPRYHNRTLYVFTKLRRRRGLGPQRMHGVVQVPPVLPRLIPIDFDAVGNPIKFALLEDIIRARLPELFGEFAVQSSTTFRITRDSDIDLITQESDDMLRLIEERLRARNRSDAVRIEVGADADDELLETIIRQEELRTTNETDGYSEVYKIQGPLDLTVLSQLTSLPQLATQKEVPIVPLQPRGLRRRGESLLSAIRRRDILLHHPYDLFSPVVEFVNLAKNDPKVLAIKQTVYRTSGDSPIVQSLIAAAENGKHVTALVELKARFDEQANVEWARRLERAGAHVVYGFMDLKTHCKISMISRQEDDGIRSYAHLATGNYNPTTAQVYTDLGLFTANPMFTRDIAALFNLLTGYSQGHRWKKLVVAPQDLHDRTVQLIQEQTDAAVNGKPARIFAKLNSLVDPAVIRNLYQASQAGVQVELLVRGICCLRPGIQGISENIRVWSIVDRFLEHSRILVFGEGDAAKVFCSSADWMPRNFYRRVEVMFPIDSSPLRRRILNEILPTYRRDNIKARELMSDGTYRRVSRDPSEPPFRSQMEMARINLENSVQSKSRLYVSGH